MVNVELLHTSGVQSARAQWWSLWQSAVQQHPFQSPAWLLPWSHHFAPGRMHAVAVHAGSTLVAYAPFFTWHGSLLLAGTGPSDYGADLFAGERDDTAAALLAGLCDAAEESAIHNVDLQQLQRHSPLLHASAPPGWRQDTQEADSCPVAHLRGDDGLAEVSRAWRRNIARAQRLLTHAVDWDIGLADIVETAAAADTFTRLHARRWRDRGGSALLADERMQRFMRAVLAELDASGMLRLQRLRIAQQTVALAMVMHCGNAAYFYMAGFDPQWSRFSPGLVTIAAAMRQAAREGAREFHFLRGREGYKYHLGARDRPTYRRILRRHVPLRSAPAAVQRGS